MNPNVGFIGALQNGSFWWVKVWLSTFSLVSQVLQSLGFRKGWRERRKRELASKSRYPKVIRNRYKRY